MNAEYYSGRGGFEPPGNPPVDPYFYLCGGTGQMTALASTSMRLDRDRPVAQSLGILCVLLAVVLCCAAFPPIAAAQQIDLTTLPARDTHEGLTIAADPYTDAARSKERFGKKHPYEAGLLAVEIVVRNENTRPVRLDLNEIRLLLSPPGNSRQRLAPLETDVVIERILHKEQGGPNPTVSRLPIPRVSKPDRSKDWKNLEAAILPFVFANDILPPQSTVRGFLFFDMARRFEWVPYARVYVPDLKYMDDGQALFYFEVDLAKAVPRGN